MESRMENKYKQLRKTHFWSSNDRPEVLKYYFKFSPVDVQVRILHLILVINSNFNNNKLWKVLESSFGDYFDNTNETTQEQIKECPS